MRVYMNPEPEAIPNLARRASVSVSSYRLALNRHREEGRARERGRKDRGGEQAIDGEFGQFSRWQAAGTKDPEWIELDFGHLTSFDTIRLYATHGSMTAMPAFDVLVGDKPASGRLVFSASATQATTSNNPSLYGNALVRLPRQNARYLRIEFKSGPVILDELEVFDGTPPARSPIYEPGDTHIRLRQSITPAVLAKRRDLLVWFEYGAQKVFRDDVVLSTRTPEPLARVSAARGESEAFQIVLFHPRGLKDARLVINRLEGPMKIPASFMHWYSVGYVYVRSPSEKLVSQLGRTVGLGKGWYPDYLMPTKSVDVPPGKQQPLWVVVDVPREALPGDYTARMTLLADGGVSISLKLQVHVYNFVLPLPRQFKAIGRETGRIYGDLEATKTYFEQLSKRGFSGQAIFWPPPRITEVRGKLRFDWSDFDEMAAFCINQLRFRSLTLPGDVFAYHDEEFSPPKMVGRAGLRPDTPAFWASLEESLAEYGRHLQQKGWTRYFIFYITDEPSKSVQSYVLRVAEVVKRRMPGIPILWIGGWVYPDLIGRVDIWGPNVKAFESNTYAERRAAGDAVWTYSNSLWLIDTPPLGARALGWAYAKYGISGVFFYSLNKWSQNPYEMPRNNATRNGDPMFFYPHSGGVKGELVNSIRIEMLRDGWDDWEYIQLLRTLVKKAGIMSQSSKPEIVDARTVLEEANDLIYQYGLPIVANRDRLIQEYEDNPESIRLASKQAKFDYLNDPERFLEVRNRLARAIEKVKLLVGLPAENSN